MGQVISFPGQPAAEATGVTSERRHAFVTGLCVLTYLLGFFIVGPSLALFAFGFATTAHAGSAVMCVGGLLVTWRLTRWAYTRI
ncbi:MAG TPA: hypothetical protein VNS09_17110 [Solirubrobacter sp.]|nr:hypothetical protein [Solirubrobacter sp.]